MLRISTINMQINWKLKRFNDDKKKPPKWVALRVPI